MPSTSWVVSAGSNTSSILEGSALAVADRVLLALAPLEDRADGEDHDEPGDDRRDALPHRPAGGIHEIDGLGFLRFDLPRARLAGGALRRRGARIRGAL